MDLFTIWCIGCLAETMIYLVWSTNDLFITPQLR